MLGFMVGLLIGALAALVEAVYATDKIHQLEDVIKRRDRALNSAYIKMDILKKRELEAIRIIKNGNVC